MKMRLAIAAFTLCTSALLSGSAHAVHDVGCGGSWTTGDSCGFQPSGLPLLYTAESFVTSGVASVHVRISRLTAVGELILFECSASGAGTSTPHYATCGGSVGPTQGVYAQTAPLECRVNGRGKGTYFCGNPCPRPPPAPCF